MPERRHCGGHTLFIRQANEVAMRFSISGLVKFKLFDESLAGGISPGFSARNSGVFWP